VKDNETGKLELLIGSFILGGLILIMGMILLTSEGLSVFGNSYKIVVELTHIGDLKRGAPIKQGGVKIGSVDSIKLIKKTIEIECNIDRTYQLTADCTAHIANAGLVGDTFLEIAQGESDESLPMNSDGPAIPRIHGESQIGMTEIMGKVQDISEEIQELVKNLNVIVGDEEVQADIKQTVDNVNHTTKEAEALVIRLHSSAKMIEEASQDVSKTTEAARKMIETVSQLGISDLLADNKMADRIVSQWVSENRRLTAEEMALEWKRFSALQRSMYPILRDPKYSEGVPPWKKEGLDRWRAEQLKKHEENR